MGNFFMHIHTGSMDTKKGWIKSYDAEELEERGLTAEDAFSEDDGVTLIEVDKNGMEVKK